MTIELQIVGSLLRAVAEEMGAVLVRSAFSANIKERRDCSTALFDERGRMVAQAEHIPVHLGAMPDAVAAVMQHDPTFGEVWALNDPYAGGTHLPDITLVSRTETGFAVTRAHHDVDDSGGGLHVARGNCGRRARIDEASFGSGDRDGRESTARCRQIWVDEDADDVEARRARNRQRTIQVPVVLRGGAGEVDGDAVALDRHG